MSQKLLRSLALLALPMCSWSCGSSSDEGGGQTVKPEPVRLTTEVTLAPSKQPIDPPDDRDSADPALRDAMLAEGYGDLVEGAGEAYTTRAPPGQTPPAAGANAKRLARFVHMPDFQLADDESPTRLATFDGPGSTSGAYRPQ